MEAVNNPGDWVKDTWGLSELGNFSLEGEKIKAMLVVNGK